MNVTNLQDQMLQKLSGKGAGSGQTTFIEVRGTIQDQFNLSGAEFQEIPNVGKPTIVWQELS